MNANLSFCGKKPKGVFLNPKKDCEFGEEVGKFYRNKRNKVLLFKSKQMLRIIVAAAVQQNGKSGENKEKKDCQ